MTLTSPPPPVDYDPVKDLSYRDAVVARDVADWLAWLDLGGARPRTLDQYERDLAVMCLMYPTLEIAEFTDAELLHVIRSWPAPSRRVRKEAIKSFFKWALRTRRILVNPCDFLPDVKRTPQQFIDVFTAAEQEALCGLPLIDGALMAVLLDSGLRKAEASSLRAAHILLDRRRLVVFQGKGGKDRVIPMTDRLTTKVADLLLTEGIEPGQFLWYVTTGGGRNVRRDWRIGEGSFARWWKRCVVEAGVKYRKPHTARHTFATEWRRRGLDLDEIGMILGHDSIRTTSDLYVHTNIEDVAARMEELSPQSW